MNATLINCIIARSLHCQSRPSPPLTRLLTLSRTSQSSSLCSLTDNDFETWSLSSTLSSHCDEVSIAFSPPLHTILIECIRIYLHNAPTPTHRHRPSWYTHSCQHEVSLSHSHSHQRLTFTWRRLILTFAQFVGRQFCALAIAASFRLILLCKMGAFQRFILNYCHEIRCNFRLDVIWKYFCCLFFCALVQPFFTPFRFNTHCFSLTY